MTTREDISEWFDRGVEGKSSHMLVVCDTYDWDDYPVYAKTEEEAKEEYNSRNGKNMQKVMEVYNLSHNKDEQLNMRRCFNLEGLK